MNTNDFMNNDLMISTVNNIAHEYINYFRWIKKFPMVKKISAMKDGYEKMSAMEEMLAKKKISPINIKNTQDEYYSK